MSEVKPLAELRRQNLQAWMDERNLSQTAVATKLGVGRAYVSLLLQTKPDADGKTRAFGEKAARLMEAKLFMPEGYLDSDGQQPEAASNWDHPKNLEPGVSGLLPYRELSLDPATREIDIRDRNLPDVALSRESLLKMRVTRKDQLAFMVVTGEALTPQLRPGDIVLVDQAQTEVSDGQVYVIRYGDELRFRRLARRFDGGLILRSDNPHPTEEVVSAQDATLIRVIGRVVARWGVL